MPKGITGKFLYSFQRTATSIPLEMNLHTKLTKLRA